MRDEAVVSSPYPALEHSTRDDVKLEAAFDEFSPGVSRGLGSGTELNDGVFRATLRSAGLRWPA